MYTDDFEHLWSLYPRRVGKGQAYKAYQHALKKVSYAELRDAVEQYAAFVKHIGTEAKYIPHLSTWINGERWSDDLATETASHNGRQSASSLAFSIAIETAQKKSCSMEHDDRELGFPF